MQTSSQGNAAIGVVAGIVHPAAHGGVGRPPALPCDRSNGEAIMTVHHRIGRNFLLMLATIAAAISAALSAPAAQTTFKIVMPSDLKPFDPVWSGAYIVRNYGYMVYDVLFAIDEEFRVKPQMAESIRASGDGLTHTIALREGLTWHDGSPVTADDCVASLKRWSARDPMGQKLADFLKEYRVIDSRTFEIVLKEKFGPLLEALGKPSVVVPFMMPKRVAETDP